MKYEPEKHDGRFRPRALRDIPEAGVKVGDLGGYMESSDNLSHSGRCWIGPDVQMMDYSYVGGDAIITGSVWMSDYARVYGDSRIKGTAWLSGHSKIYGNATVYGTLWLSEHALIYDEAQIHGCAWIKGRSKVCGDVVLKGETRLDGDDMLSSFRRLRYWASNKVLPPTPRQKDKHYDNLYLERIGL